MYAYMLNETKTICVVCAGEAPKNNKATTVSAITHHLQRRLLVKAEMQQKMLNKTQNAKKSNKIQDVDEIGGNDINRESELYNFIDDASVNDVAAKQGE